MNKPKINENLNERMLGELRIESMGLKAEMMKMNENVGLWELERVLVGLRNKKPKKFLKLEMNQKS